MHCRVGLIPITNQGKRKDGKKGEGSISSVRLSPQVFVT